MMFGDVQQSLTRVFQSVCITSPTSFTFSPSERIPPITVNTDEKQHLTRALRDVIYNRCFARHLSDMTPATKTLIPPEDFCRRLSAANQGRDAWLPGWRVRELKDSGVIIVSQGERIRYAEPGCYAMTFGEDVRPCIGCGVTLRLRKESFGLQDATYCALGEESPSPEEASDILRIYFNAEQEAAISLVKLVTNYFNDWRVPFTLKIMFRPQDRDRCDATVLYFPKSYYRSFVKLLNAFPDSLLSLLIEGVPLFTKPLLNGIGLAESPTGDESFGLNRCRLVSEGIVDAWLDGHQDVNARMQATEKRFASEGFSLARPYLNPGSIDSFSTRIEDYPHAEDPRVREPTPLTKKNVLAFLRERGLCTGTENEDEWLVSEYSSRNRNFGITRSGRGQRFFVKQLRVQDPESFAMMQREATIYQLAQHDPDFSVLKELTPSFIAFADDAKVMILEFIKADNFLKAHLRLKQFPVELGRNLGVALAVLHSRVGRGTSAAPPQKVFSLRPPGIFDAHRNGPLVRWLSPVQRLLIARVRECAELATALDELAASWRHDTFIHGDIRFENCLALEPHLRVVLVDWELADFGEASWDVGSVLQAYLAASLLALPTFGPASLEKQLNNSTMPVNTLKAAVQAFWRAYCEERLLAYESQRILIERSLQCAAARMIQTALEVVHGQAQLTPQALVLFDGALELITRPQPIAQFLGT